MKKYYLLVVRCNRNKLHVFVDSDPEYRVVELNTSPRAHKHLWKHRPIWLVAKWDYPTKKSAHLAAKTFKKLSKPTKLEIIEEGWQLEFGTPDKPVDE